MTESPFKIKAKQQLCKHLFDFTIKRKVSFQFYPCSYCNLEFGQTKHYEYLNNTKNEIKQFTKR